MSHKLDWTQLIKEHYDWEAYNFPDATLEDDLMGVIEEVGELAHHHLKMKQNIRGNEDHIAGGQDAVGDISIYMLGVMHHMGINSGPEVLSASRADTGSDLLLLSLSYDAGCLVGVHLGRIAGGYYHVLMLIYTLERYCIAMGWDYKQIVQSTWDKLKRRDWQKNPITGASAIELLREHDGDPDWEGL